MFLKWSLRPNPARIFILILSVWACSINLSSAQTDTVPKNILILHSHDFSLPAYEKIQIGIENSLHAGGFRDDNVLVEFMDLGHNPGSEHRSLLNMLLRKRYAESNIGLIITTYTPSVNFMLNEGKDFLPGIPMIAMLGPEKLDVSKIDRQIILVPGKMDMSGTLKSAMDLLPDTRRVLVIHGPSQQDKRYETQARNEFETWGSKLEIEYLSNLPLEEIMRKVATQPLHTIIMYLNFSRDLTGKPYTPRTVLENISRAANVPVFGFYDTLIGHGIVGGSMLSFQAEGTKVGELAIDILNGKIPANPLQNQISTTKFIFDWKQLNRWGLSEARLPADSTVINRPDTLWYRYKAAILVILGFILILCLTIILLFLNILQRKRAEKALKNSEMRYRRLFESAKDGILILDAYTGKVVDVNPFLIQLLGYSYDALYGQCIWELGAFKDIAASKEAFRILQDKEYIRYEHMPLKSQEGQIIDVEFISNVYLVDNIKVIQCNIRDITERKRLTEALLEGKQQYDNLVANIPVGVYIMHSKPSGAFAFDYVSPKVAEMFNTSTESFLADPQAGFQPIHPDDLDSLVKLNQKVFEQPQPFSWEGRAVIDGTVKWLSIASSPELLKNGAVIWHGVVADITTRKQSEATLREHEFRTKAMLEAIPDLMFRMDSQGVFLDYKAEESNLHVQSIPIIGRRNRDITPPEFADLIDRQIRTTLETNKIQTFEYSLPIPDKGVRDYEARMVAIGNYEVVAIVRDVTIVKQAEEERKALQDRLQKSEKMEALGIMAGRIAHDLNNVLGVVSGYSEILVELIPGGSPLLEYAAKIQKSAGKAAAIVDDLLTLTRRGVRVMELAKFNKIITDLLATPEFDKLAAYHPKVIVKTDLAVNLLNISGSPVHLEKTVLNLVSNAVESIAGSGEVHIRTENRYLDKAIQGYQTVKEGEYVVLTVSDTGKGIPASELKNIFEPFYTNKSMGRSGTGLGLAIVWGAVQDHNGYIDVQSIEGKGTTFTLFFPATREEVEEEAPKVSMDQYMGHGESVLVIDDVQEQREVATTLLTQLGYSVNAVSSGEDAVEYLKSNKVDILVLDMIMEPGIDGFDTYRQILEIKPKQKAIIVSGFSETDRTKEAQKLGAGAYVRKPYLKEKIGLAIRNELAKY